MAKTHKIKVDGVGDINLKEPDDYIGQGGQAQVFKKEKLNLAFKIYHDPSKMIPEKKIQELSTITNDNVIKPLNKVRGPKGGVIGYSMKFVLNSHPLCKLFTKTFRNKNNITPDDIVDLVKKMQETTRDIHRQNFLVADLNEMNFLVTGDFKTPLFIDTDSYKTPSFPATAIMASVRDRTVPFGHFTKETDWFSFAVVTFQLYMGVHPYKGRHPNYDIKEWEKRMDDGVSVFDPKAKLPPACQIFDVIPQAHLDWYKGVFTKNLRTPPPFVDGMLPVLITHDAIFMIEGDEHFATSLVRKYDSNVMGVYNVLGVKYIVTENQIWKSDKVIDSDISDFNKVIVAKTGDATPIICKKRRNKITFHRANNEQIGNEVNGNEFMERDGRVYVVNNGKLVQYSFTSFPNGNIVALPRIMGNVFDNVTKMFDGTIYQDLLGKPFFHIPYEDQKCYFGSIDELKGYRILDAKAEGNLLVVLGEKNGRYDRFVVTFEDDFSSYGVRLDEDVEFGNVNFTVLENGICILVTSNDEVELFKKSDQVKKIKNPPFDLSTRLLNSGGKVFFINDKEIYATETKKK